MLVYSFIFSAFFSDKFFLFLFSKICDLLVLDFFFAVYYTLTLNKNSEKGLARQWHLKNKVNIKFDQDLFGI